MIHLNTTVDRLGKEKLWRFAALVLDTGRPKMAIIALKCLSIELVVNSISKLCNAAWNNDQLAIYEPGLDDVVKQYRGKNLFFSTDVKKHVHEADTVFVSINKLTKTMSRSWKNRRFDVLGECGSGGCRCVLVVDVKECSLYFLLLVVMSF